MISTPPQNIGCPYEIKEIIFMQDGPNVRQDRLNTESISDSFHLVIAEKSYSICNISLSGVAIRGNLIPQFSDSPFEAHVHWQGKLLEKITITQARRQAQGEGLLVGFKVEGGTLARYWIEGVLRGQQAQNAVRAQLADLQFVPEKIQHIVESLAFRIRVQLESMDLLEKETETHSLEMRKKYFSGISESSAEELSRDINQSLQSIFNQFTDLSVEQQHATGKYIRTILGPTLRISSMFARLESLPMGYPIDHEVIKNLNSPAEDLVSLRQILIDRVVRNILPVQTIRNRFAATAKWISDQIRMRNSQSEIRILSLLSGSCPELSLAFSNLPPELLAKVHTTVIDQDIHALHFGQQCLESMQTGKQGRFGSVKFCRKSVKAIAHFGPESGEFDIIVCPIFFDYLPEEMAEIMIRNLSTAMRPEASLYFQRLKCKSISYAHYRYVWNWELAARDLTAFQRESATTMQNEFQYVAISAEQAKSWAAPMPSKVA